MYLSKFVASSSSLSRRAAERAIREGFVVVNGQLQKDPSVRVAESDCVKLRGVVLKYNRDRIVFALNKPEGFITSKKDIRGRATVMDLVPRNLRGLLFPVGRLDLLTSGILLLTNDGDLAYKLCHPKFEVPKIYEAFLDQAATHCDLEKLCKGFY